MRFSPLGFGLFVAVALGTDATAANRTGKNPSIHALVYRGPVKSFGTADRAAKFKLMADTGAVSHLSIRFIGAEERLSVRLSRLRKPGKSLWTQTLETGPGKILVLAGPEKLGFVEDPEDVSVENDLAQRLDYSVTPQIDFPDPTAAEVRKAVLTINDGSTAIVLAMLERIGDWDLESATPHTLITSAWGREAFIEAWFEP